MVNELLINLVNSTLGPGKRTSKGNAAYICPFCNHHKKKLEINFNEGKKGYQAWHCWVCHSRGLKLKSLFKQIKAKPDHFFQLNKLVKDSRNYDYDDIEYQDVELPKEYKSLIGDNSIISRHAKAYLKTRNITNDDILKYNIGYCEKGEYTNTLIIPSYDESGILNYFTSRSFKKDAWKKYQNPNISRNIVPFELLINWDLPIILCEGPFDAMAIKRNAIPLFGSNIQSELMKKILSSQVKKIYVALDKDALKQALTCCETLINNNKEVYLVELGEQDPSEMGFTQFTHLIQTITPIDTFQLMEKRISLI